MKKTMVMVLFLLFLSGNLNRGKAETNPNDVAAMQALLKSISGNGALTALKWSPKTDPCTWDLVTCYDGRVTAIQVGNKSLHGVLPSSVGKLTALTRLELQNNFLNGPLPFFGGNLTALQALLLHDNQFTEMPLNFFKGMSSLEAVYLDENPFAPWQFSDSLKDCESLVNFSANSANITGVLPEFLGTSFPSLDHLGLAFNSLTGRIPESFFGSGIRSLWVNNQDGSGLVGDIRPVSGMTEAEELWLHSNSFSGPLPSFENLTSLKDLQLRDNQFTGIVPKSLLSLKSLDKVTLTNNLLQGPVPKFPKIRVLDLDPKSESFCIVEGGDCDVRVNVLLSVAKSFVYPVKFAENWKGNDPCNGWLGITCEESGNITVINFQNLGLNGSVPSELSLIPSVKSILLASNNLTGVIPKEVTELPNLKELDLSNNNLSGEVPSFSKNVLVKTDGNPNIGKDIIAPKTSLGSSTNSVDVGPKSSSSGSSSHGRSKLFVIILCSLLGSICLISLLCALALLYYRRTQNFARVQSPNRTVIHPRYSGSDPDATKITITGEGTNAIGSATSEAYSLASSNRSDVHVVDAGNMVISIQVLRNVTNNFSEENVLGRGGFGTVYKGELHDGTKIAVKRMESGVMGSKGLTEFTSEIAVLTKVRHRNLVSLLGYCLDGNERLLVYEYMPQGPLSRHIFEWNEEGLKPLEWKRRLSIALDVARGVEYLHNLAHQSFIHRDLKPSNILLGDDMKAKVADFGLVRLAPDGKCCSVETRLAGTFGYLAPEYAVTGRVTTKADVFSFGVILMELITGRKALDETQPEESIHLVTWFRRMQLNNSSHDDRKPIQKSVIDPALSIEPEDEETLVSISTVSELAGHCCAREPNQRPDMGHAVNVLASLAELWKPSDPDSEDSYGIDLDLTLPQALKKWQGMDGATSSFLDTENTQTSIPTRPPGFADSFTSADGR